MDLLVLKISVKYLIQNISMPLNIIIVKAINNVM